MKKRIPLLFSACLLLAACVKNDVNEQPQTPAADLLAPAGFNFATAKKVALEIELRSNNNKPLPGVKVQVYPPDDNANALFTALTDANGRIIASINVPARFDSLLIDPSYVGLLRNAVAAINNNTVKAIIGGTGGFSGDIVPIAPNGRVATDINTQKIAGTLGSTVVTYNGSFDNDGRPTSLAPSAVISPELLSFINTSLPEGKSIQQHHPAFLSANAETRLHIKKTSDVWLTFVHEGTVFKNSLGFYSYPTNRQPHAPGDIDTIKIAFPNASLSGSGGSLKSGDRVYLGRFGDNTTIDLVLLQNAWNSANHKVSADATKYFADDNMNNEKANTKRHAVLLHDTGSDLFLYGFEDTQRDNTAADNDFNDLVFYATTNPVESISATSVSQLAAPTDSDADGVPDLTDEFPTDAGRAYRQYFPAKNTWSTLSFEDNWPYTGDYDLNDLVVSYRYQLVMNAQNKVVEMYGDYTVKAIGATQKNCFGVQLPLTPDKVAGITGQRLSGGLIATNSNGTEAGQTRAVFFPFDDPKTLFPGTAGMVNVYSTSNETKSDTARLKISFTVPLSATELDLTAINPFLVPGQNREREIHLPNFRPTDKADLKLLGTGKDNSNIAKNKYYLSENNWPWALSFSEPFDYPTEGSQIARAYTNFTAWAKSAGSSNRDWYTNKPGYRIGNLIYKK